MIPMWPAELRKFQITGWQSQPQDARRKRLSDAGPPSYRRRYSSVPKLVALSLVVSRNEKAVFDQFYHVTCKEGAKTFYLPDPSTDGWPMLSAAGEPMLSGGVPLLLAARWLCAWGDPPPVETMDGDVDFVKQFSVVVMP